MYKDNKSKKHIEKVKQKKRNYTSNANSNSSSNVNISRRKYIRFEQQWRYNK